MDIETDHGSELSEHLGLIDVAVRKCEPRELAALLRERRLTLAELGSLRGVDEGSVIDELARRRTDRRAGSDVGKDAGGGSK